MSLSINYCKEIAKELRQHAVYLPGSSVSPGDIISFSETTVLGAAKPIGSFKKIGALSSLGISLEVETDQHADSYVYASKGSVSVTFEASAAAGDTADGKLSVNFTKEGSTYLSAVECKETRFVDLTNLENLLAPHKDELEWKHFFIVTGVTVAAKALIMQSNTSNASLEIEGNVKLLSPGTEIVRDAGEVNAGLNLKITKHKEASFIKDWSDNVAVFFKLVRYKRRFLGDFHVETHRALLLESKAAKNYSPFIIDDVDPEEIL